MGDYTTRLNLYLPGGGGSGTITPDEPADIDKLNGNFKKIDLAAGIQFLTSTTHPTSPFDGQQVYESDTKKIVAWSDDASDWVELSSSADASTTVKGIAELATDAETITGTDTTRVVTPAGLAALVAALKGLPFAQAAGQVSAGANTTGVSSVTFPSGRFSQPPIVSLVIRNYVASSKAAVHASLSSSGFTLSTYNVNTGANISGVAVDWTAVQMTSSSAAG